MDALKKVFVAVKAGFAKAKPTWEILSVRHLLIALFLGSALQMQDFGVYLDDNLFFRPIMKLEAILGQQPALDEKVRVVLGDDRTIKKFDRMPTFSEWYAVAQKLFAVGFKVVLIQEPQDLGAQNAVQEKLAPGHFLAVGVVDTRGKKSSRSRDVEEIASELLTSGWPDAAQKTFGDLNRIIGPAPVDYPFISKIGSLNISSDISMPIGLKDATGKVLPHLALFARGSIDKQEGFDLLRLPRTTDGKLYVHFVSLKSFVANVTSLDMYYPQKNVSEGVLETLPAQLLERLKGGEIAIFVPAAYTGARFVNSPAEGTVPAYMGLLSLVTSTLQGSHITKPVPDFLIVVLSVLAIFGLVELSQKRNSKKTVAALSVLLVSLFLAGVVALFKLGFFLPVMQVSFLCVVSILYQTWDNYLRSLTEKAKLDQELALGQTVQSLFLASDRSGQMAGWQWAIRFKPHGHLSGDWFHTFVAPSLESTPQADALAVLAIGDAVGKGTSAALLTATLSGVWNQTFSGETIAENDLANLAERIHNTLLKTYKGEQNTTASLAMIRGSRLSLAACAAPRWIQIRGGKADYIRAGRTVALGFAASTSFAFHPNEIEALPGDVYIAFTDGVCDGLPMQKFKEVLSEKKLPCASLEETLETIEEAALTANVGELITDDFTLAVLVKN